MTKVNDTVILLVSDGDFELFRDLFHRYGRKNVDEIAFSVFTSEGKYVIIRESFTDVKSDEFEIVLFHELGHCAGLKDEEDADRYALNFLSENAKGMLKEMWMDRHGKEYYETAV